MRWTAWIRDGWGRPENAAQTEEAGDAKFVGYKWNKKVTYLCVHRKVGRLIDAGVGDAATVAGGVLVAEANPMYLLKRM